ncbi:TIGR02234 family membrane protein [Mycobacterium sp. MMS18-G62]
MIRLAQLVLVLAAGALWAASRLTWVEVTSFDGLGQPKTAALNGAAWSTALVPLALLVAAAAIAALAVRGWPLRLLATLVGVVSAGMAYLAISLWVIRDVAVRACHLANVPVANLVGTQRHYLGAVITLVAAVATLAGAVMLMRSAAKGGAARYVRRASVPVEEPGDAMSERMIWDALDEGSDPTQDTANPDNKGR